MCDSIANGGPISFASTGGGSCPPANVIVASNVLATNGNVIAGNVISQDGTFTGNLYVAGQIIGTIIYNSINIAGIANLATVQAGTIQAGFYTGDGSGMFNLNASNIVGSANLMNLFVSNSLTTTNVFFQNAILPTNLPILNTAQGTWGSGANVPQVTIDQYGRVSAASNVAITSSQWTTVNGNVAYQNGVSIGTLSNPPNGSNLYVLGTATITNIAGNGALISFLNSANLVGNVANANVALVVSQAAQPNITSVGVLTALTVSGILNSNLYTGNGSGLANISGSNVTGNVANANVALVVSQAAQPNITSVGVLTALNVSGILNSNLYTGNGSGLANISGSNVTGNVANANVALVVSQAYQPNITSVGVLTALTVSGILNSNLYTGNGSGLANISGSNVTGNVANATVALVVSQAAQPNITSVGTLASLTVSGTTSSGTFSGSGSGLTNVPGTSISGSVQNAVVAQVVSQASQPNITSVGTLTSLSVVGTVDAGTFSGSGASLTNISASSVVGTVGTARSVTDAAQPNITSVGTLTGLVVQGLLTASNGSSISNLNASSVILGTLPTTVLPSSGVSAGLYGSSSNVASVNVDQYGRITSASNVTIMSSQWSGTPPGPIYYANYVGIGSSVTPTANLQVTGNVVVSNSLTTPNVYFTNQIQSTNLPTSGVVAGTYGSSANVSQVSVDQYGRITSAANVSFTASSQWTTIDGNVAYQNGVSIGTLSNPPNGSNLYVLGTATITNIAGNGASISSLNSANLVGNVANANVALVVSQAAQPNITSVGVLTALTVSGILNSNLYTGNGSGLANISGSNVTGNVANANVALVVSQASQPNITSVGILTNLNVSGTSNTANLVVPGSFIANSVNTTFFFDTITIPYINVTTLANIASLVSPTINVGTLNVLTISNLNSLTTNLTASTANVGTLNVITISNLNSLTTNLTASTANVGTLNVITISNLNSLTTNLTASTANVGTLNVITISNLNSLTTNLTASTANVGTLNVITISNLNSLTTNLTASTANVGTLNVITISNLNSLTTNLTASTANVGTLNVITISNLNSLTTNLTASTANVGTLNVSSLETTGNLTVTGNIIPNSGGNTYAQGNIVLSGNVFSSLGLLGAGGGYYMSLPNNIAIQPGYNGSVYGEAYPLSIGLSNGFTISGTSTLITITQNGNFKFNTAGPYILNAVFNGSDNITGLAVGSNVADIHGQDQGYLYRYTTFVSQNPTEVIQIPINVSNTALYYYLDLFKVDQGTIYSSNIGTGGTWLTIAPLTGGGLATGGPGGTPGTQWISAGSNIYFPNSVGVGPVIPVYNLDVVGDIHATGNVYSSQRVVTNQTTTYTANALDYYIGINGTGVTVDLPQGSSLPTGKTYVIKDESGHAATNHITVAPYSGNLIDGQATLTLVVNYIAVTILWTGSAWSII